MRGPAPLEGEKLLRAVRSHPLARLADYGPGLALLLLAALLAGAAAAGMAGAEALDGAAGPLAVPLVLVAWWLSLAATTGPFALWRGAAWPLGHGVALAVLGGLAAVVLALPDPSAPEALGALPWLTALGAAGPLAHAEALRRSPTWFFTNLRLVRREGLVRRREESWRLTRLERAELSHVGPRWLDLGEVRVVAKDEELRLRGVRPVRRLRDELEMLLHLGVEAPYLGQQRDLAEQVGKLLRPGEAPPRP